MLTLRPKGRIATEMKVCQLTSVMTFEGLSRVEVDEVPAGETIADIDRPEALSLLTILEYIADDELVEVTPKNIRIRKKILDKLEEKRKAKGLLR